MKRLYSHYFPTPSYLTMNSFAIDISDQSVKYGELKATSDGLRLGKYGREKIPEGVVISGRIEKEDELVHILKKIKEKEKIKYIRVSLPEEQMYLFTLSLPKSDDLNIKEMILLQIEEHIPLKAPDSLFDFDIINEDDKNIIVEVVAIAIVTMESYLSVFNESGLIPISFELEAQATARAVIPNGYTKTIMIVDFGDDKTGISISSNGRVLLTTTLSIGGIDFTNMIAKNFGLSFSEAKKMKHGYGINKGSKAEDIFPAIINGLSVLRDEINKQYVYWETHNANNGVNHNKISHIILCGGDANLAGLADYLELSMKVKVQNANVWVNISNPNDTVPEMSFEESLSYATVLGLALGSYIYKPQAVINVLSDKEKKHIYREYWMRLSTMFLDIVIFAGIIAIILLLPPYFISKSRETLVNEKLEIVNKENRELATINIDETVNDINSKLELLSKGEPTYQISERIITSILSSRTEGVTFSQILFSKQTVKAVSTSVVEIHGVATNRDTLRNFKTNLDNNPNFSSVNLPVSNFLEKVNLPFTISIILK